MKISSTNLRQIERYLSNELPAGERLLFSARLILDPTLKHAVRLHRQSLILTQAYARLQQKKELNALHEQLFSKPAPGLRQIINLFSR